MNLSQKLKKSERLESRPTYYITEYIWRVLIIQRFILLPLSRTNITPNLVTIFGILCVGCSFALLYSGYNALSGCFYLLYSLADHTDGMLARLKGQSSALGHIMDYISDYIAWFGLIVLAGYLYDVSVWLVGFTCVTLLIHQQFCKHFIHARLKRLKTIYRFGLKKWFLERGVLLGIDASLLAWILAFGIFSTKFELCFYILGVIYILDIIYRLIELNLNLKLQKRLGGGRWTLKTKPISSPAPHRA